MENNLPNSLFLFLKGAGDKERTAAENSED